VINLAGATIGKRWTKEYKEEIYHSRIDTTAKIVRAIHATSDKPSLFISTSATGIYAASGTHSENSSLLAVDFLGKLTKDWEKKASEAADSTRVVILRTGIVMGKSGGMLKSIYPLFRRGLGGIVGSGQQYISWIHITDLVGIYQYIIGNKDISGIINAVAPSPVTNQYFTKTLGNLLNQPTRVHVPYFALKLLYGEAADVLVAGQYAIPERLLNYGYEFRFPTIEEALSDIYSS
jgi:uncharacterized protein